GSQVHMGMPIGQFMRVSQSVPDASMMPVGAACSRRQPPGAQLGSLKQDAGIMALTKTEPFQTVSKAPPAGIKNAGGSAQSAAQAQEPFSRAPQVCAQDASCQVSAWPMASFRVKGTRPQPAWEPR